MFLGCLSGIILTIARFANKKLLNEIYYNMFVKKSHDSYISYKFKHSKIGNLKMPLTVSYIEDDINISSGSLYYNDLYTNTTIIVLAIQSMYEILTTLSICFEENCMKESLNCPPW